MRTSQKLTLSLGGLALLITACSAKVETPSGTQIPNINQGGIQQVDPTQPQNPAAAGFPTAMLGRKFQSGGMLELEVTSPGGTLVRIVRNCKFHDGFCEVLGQLNQENFALYLNDSNSTYVSDLSNGRKAITSGTATETTLKLSTQVVGANGKLVQSASHSLTLSQSPCGSPIAGLEDQISIRSYYPDGYSDETTCISYNE